MSTVARRTSDKETIVQLGVNALDGPEEMGYSARFRASHSRRFTRLSLELITYTATEMTE